MIQQTRPSSGPAVFVDVDGFEVSVESNGLPPRSVLVAGRPLPRYAPLLMGASGLVTKGGSEAAHLVEVARALGVPTVVGCDLEGVRTGGGMLVAVDGHSGAVHVLDLGH